MYWWFSRMVSDDIPLHDLHVVDVIEQLEPLRAHPLADLDAPGGVVAHVILVVCACC